MGLEITVLTGSPRKEGNTFALTDAFAEAARKAGHEITRFDTAFMDIKGCKACMGCFKTHSLCVQKDDFSQMTDTIESADVLVFSAPVYFYSFPAQIKAALDRTFCFAGAQRSLAGKRYAVLSCCEEADPGVFDGIVKPLERVARLCKWELAGTVLVNSVNEIGDIDKTDGCKRAAALARSL
ncbi:MAG: flavodoxin family protein [Coriobacteriales bacterium]|jgi:multimeric flavodoxin WrbA